MKPNIGGYGYSVSSDGAFSYFWSALHKRKTPQVSQREAFDVQDSTDMVEGVNNNE